MSVVTDGFCLVNVLENVQSTLPARPSVIAAVRPVPSPLFWTALPGPSGRARQVVVRPAGSQTDLGDGIRAGLEAGEDLRLRRVFAGRRIGKLEAGETVSGRVVGEGLGQIRSRILVDRDRAAGVDRARDEVLEVGGLGGRRPSVRQEAREARDRPAGNRLLRLIPPSKNISRDLVSGVCHGTSIGPDSLAIAQPSASLAGGSESPHSAFARLATSTRPPACHLKMLTTDTEPPFVMSEVIRTSPFMCWPVKPPVPSRADLVLEEPEAHRGRAVWLRRTILPEV